MSPQSNTHLLKCWPEFFRAIQSGRKRFEIRKNDRHYQVGDGLVLQEFDPVTATYSGNELAERVIYITDAYQQPDYVVMGIEHVGCKSPGQADAALVAPSAHCVPDAPVFCAHCEHEIATCPECGKAEWRIKGLDDLQAALVAPREPKLAGLCESLCRFNADAESSCNCAAHLLYRSAALVAGLRQEVEDAKDVRFTTVVTPDGGATAAPCAIEGCRYSELDAEVAGLRQDREDLYGALCDFQSAPDCWCDSKDGAAPEHSPACAEARRIERRCRLKLLAQALAGRTEQDGTEGRLIREAAGRLTFESPTPE